MNIQEAAKLMKLGRHLRRPSMPLEQTHGAEYLLPLFVTRGKRLGSPLDLSLINRKTYEEVFSTYIPSTADLLADDWEEVG